jgi:hypothetical protein
VANTGLKDVHCASDAGGRFELAHSTKGIGQELLVVLCIHSHSASLQINDMKMIAIDQNGIGCAAKRWVQRLQTLIEIDLNQLFAWVFNQGVDKVGIALGHGQMVRVSASRDFTTAQNDL